MSHQGIIVIALRVAAITLGLNVLENFPEHYFKYLASNDEVLDSMFWLVVAAPFMLKTIIAILLWIFPSYIITSTVPDSARNSDEPEYFSNLNSAFISVIGIYIFVLSVADVVYYFTLKNMITEQFGLGAMQPVDEAAFWASLVEMVAGVALIVGNKVISKLILKIRR